MLGSLGSDKPGLQVVRAPGLLKSLIAQETGHMNDLQVENKERPSRLVSSENVGSAMLLLKVHALLNLQFPVERYSIRHF